MKKAAGLALLLILLASLTGCAGNVPANSAPQQTEPMAVHEEPVDEAESSATSEKSSDTPVISWEPNRDCKPCGRYRPVRYGAPRFSKQGYHMR